MDEEVLLVHLKRSLDGPANAGHEFMVAAEKVCFRALSSFGAGLIVRRGLLEDVAQEALMRVWANRRSCRGQSNAEVAGWIAAIARCAAVDVLRGEGPDRIEISEIMVSVDAEILEPLGVESAARSITELAWSLGSDANEVLWLRLVAGASWQSIGNDLGISWTAARRRFQRAVSRLRVLAVAGVRNAVLTGLQRHVAKEPARARNGCG